MAEPTRAASCFHKALQRDASRGYVWGNLALAYVRIRDGVALGRTLDGARDLGVEDPVLDWARAKQVGLANLGRYVYLLSKALHKARVKRAVEFKELITSIETERTWFDDAHRALGVPLRAGFEVAYAGLLLDEIAKIPVRYASDEVIRLRWLIEELPETVIPIVHRRLEATSGRVRFAILNALGVPREKASSIPYLERYLTDADKDVRGTAAATLGFFGHRSSAPAIEAAMKKEGDWNAKRCMAEACAMLGSKAGLPVLLAMLEETKDFSSPYMAVVFLPLLDDPRVLPRLVKALSHPERRVRTHAARTLRWLSGRRYGLIEAKKLKWECKAAADWEVWMRRPGYERECGLPRRWRKPVPSQFFGVVLESYPKLRGGSCLLMHRWSTCARFVSFYKLSKR